MRNTTIDFLYETLRRFPDKTCLEDKDQVLSFRSFFLEAINISKILNLTDSTNRPVAVFLPKSAPMLLSFAGILLSGNFYVPLDTKSPLSRIQKIIDNIAPVRILTILKYKGQMSSLSIPEGTCIYIDTLKQEKNNMSIEEMIVDSKTITDRIIDTDPCYVMHTSGSTGTPKGVVVSHRGVIDYIDWARSIIPIDENDSIGNQSPFYFDNSTLDIYLSWSTGARLILIPESVFLFPVKLIEYLEKFSVTFLFFVPSVLISIAHLKLLNPNRLPDLRYVVFAGEVMPTKHLAYWQHNLADKIYINLYGPTEITVDCTYFIVDRIYRPDETLPIGYPCHNSGVLILNEDNELADVNEPGELCVRGSSLALGYWNSEKISNDVFVQNPLHSNYSDRIYKTGDMVYVNEKNQIIYIGRKDNQIKHMGYRIELGEIEQAAMQLPFVDRCCVLYHKGKTEINLFYEAGEEVSTGDFRKMLSQYLPKYMLPQKVFHMNSLPLSANGKIDRTTIKNEYINC